MSDEEIIKLNYPPNSHTSKINKTVKNNPPPKKNKRIVKSAVTIRKKPLGRRIHEAIVGTDDDGGSVGNYILYDVLIPAAKSTIFEMITGGVEMRLFGTTKGTRTRRDRGKSFVSYDKVSYRQEERRPPFRSTTSHRNFDDIVITTRGEAEEVLSNLVDLTIDYDMATVADFYDFVGIQQRFTDQKYGWTNLSDATISRVRGGYLINLPKPILLD